jgi:hypothetical protein
MESKVECDRNAASPKISAGIKLGCQHQNAMFMRLRGLFLCCLISPKNQTWPAYWLETIGLYAASACL